MGINSGRG
jgi:glutathione S-transferase